MNQRITLALAVISTVLLASCATESTGWRGPVSTATRVSGGVLAAAGPAVLIAGIALDPEPTTPPVEAFIAGAALSTLGVAAVIAGGVLADEAPAPAS